MDRSKWPGSLAPSGCVYNTHGAEQSMDGSPTTCLKEQRGAFHPVLHQPGRAKMQRRGKLQINEKTNCADCGARKLDAAAIIRLRERKEDEKNKEKRVLRGPSFRTSSIS
ncbi:unnamed protein product [Symbiodinium natans]|uniref:Uncharacterized protein n=1 Tax=Symbiodinium natans TaxID=878477 RepID=A0A812L7F5_9DINO|nr:unnamed protein product [Symbiodinium natans]